MGFPEAASSSRTHQIEAVPTSSSSDGFKANLVFKEIEKKLEEIRRLTAQSQWLTQTSWL
ncbi:SCP2 isoform 18 [Pongo abelii]|uniref:SCP2 isoform 13 n=3 Tax=Pongo abelii TaxID=9601 RepID=A0A2J8V8U5_PONAB|nr:SCP2 isoform 13 [Pongo abelii]PNJ53938.1 SCP2 isoform 18 [Pongo abelii]